MATDESQIALTVGVDIQGMVDGFNKASAKVKGFGDDVSKNAGQLAKYGAAAAAAGAAVTIHLVNTAMEAISAQDDLARQLGTTAGSMATLTQAGDMAGISSGALQSSAKKLTIFMSQAAEAGSKQAETLDRLGLSSEQLSKLPLDQKIAKINDAISANIPITEQAAVAAEVFGSKAGLAMRALDSTAIAEAQHQTELLGLALSSIQSAQVEAAGDAMAMFGKATDGVFQQLAVRVAPIISQLSKEFMALVEQSGGVGKNVGSALEFVISSLGFVADAVEGVRRVWDIVFGSIKANINGVSYTVEKLGNGLLRVMDMMPGVDLSAQVAASDKNLTAMLDNFEKNMAQVDSALNTPLPSEKFKKWAADAKVASEEAAAAAVAANEKMAGTGGGASINDVNAAKKVADEEAAKEIEREKARQKELANAQKHAQRLADQQAAARAAQIESQANATADDLASIQERYMTEQQLLAQKLMDDQIALDNAVAFKQISQQEANDLEAQLTAEHQKRLKDIEMKERASRMAGISNTLGAIGQILEQGNKKQFEAGKKFAMAAAVVNMYQGISAGVALGFPAMIPAIAMATAQGLSAIGNIRRSTFNSSGGGSVAPPAAPGSYGNQQTASPQQASSNIYVRGINPGEMFSGQQLIDIINQSTANGAVLKV